MRIVALQDIDRPGSRTGMRTAGLVIAGSAVLAVSVHLQLPFWPVRLSMQSAVVLAIGLACGSRVGAAVVLAYLAEGAAGLPVFQGGAGPTYMMGPTGGYLVGLLLAVIAVGELAERGATRRWPGTLSVLLLGLVLIYVPGIAWLAVLFGLSKSIAFGLTPFLPAELCKLALVAVLAPALQRLRR